MTKKDFFRILIKVFGLFSLITSLFTVLPYSLGIAFNSYGPGFYAIIYIFIIAIFIGSIFIYLVKKPDKIINFLKLDEGFEDDKFYFEKFNPNIILNVSSLIIGGILLINNIPDFLSNCYHALQYNVAGVGIDTSIKFNWAVNFINLLIGYLLITNYEKVSELLNEKEKKEKTTP
jgi:hypothetical protein